MEWVVGGIAFSRLGQCYVRCLQLLKERRVKLPKVLAKRFVRVDFEAKCALGIMVFGFRSVF